MLPGCQPFVLLKLLCAVLVLTFGTNFKSLATGYRHCAGDVSCLMTQKFEIVDLLDNM